MATLVAEGSRADVIRRSEEAQRPGFQVNVGTAERVLSDVGGVALLAVGLKRGGWEGAATALAGGALLLRGVTGHCACYGALGVSTAEKGAGGTTGGKPVHKGVKIRKTMTINRPVEECYAAWRHFEALPRFMRHLEAVHDQGNNRLRWVARAPLGTVSWDAEIILDVPNEVISWRSLEGSDIDNAGSVRFSAAPGNRGTRMTVELNYEPPAGRVGMTIARLMGEEPEVQVREDLRHFKQMMEAGEIPTVQGQTTCRNG